MSIEKQIQAREELKNAFERINGVLKEAARGNNGRPELNLIYKGRGTSSSTIQVLVVLMPSGEIADISTEVALLLGWRYSQVHRGVIVTGVGTDPRHHLRHTLACRLYGVVRGSDHLDYQAL